MPEDAKKRIEAAYNQLENLVKEVPGYKGYKDKEICREADKLIRLKVAAGLQEQRRRLNSIEVRLATEGRLGALLVLDRSLMRLQLLIDRLKTASYGYSGLFDAKKVTEAELEALYQYDAAMLEKAGELRQLIDAVSATPGDESLTKAGSTLLEALEEMNDYFSRRQDAILQIGTL